MQKEETPYSVVILAGGKSSRMGSPKPWLTNTEGITFLSAIVSKFKAFGCVKIVVVLNNSFLDKKWKNQLLEISKDALIVPNSDQDKGRLFSLKLGLKHTDTEHIFVHNVDNPFIEDDVLQILSSQSKPNSITIPSFNGKGGHPVLITSLIRNEIITHYQNYATLKDVFQNYTKNYIEVCTNSILKNMNTPQDLEDLKHELTV